MPLWLELVGFPFPAFDSDTGSRGWPWIYPGVLDSTFGIQWKDWRKNPPAQGIPFRCDRWDVTVGLKWLLDVFGSNLGGSFGYQSQWQCCKTVAWLWKTLKVILAQLGFQWLHLCPQRFVAEDPATIRTLLCSCELRGAFDGNTQSKNHSLWILNYLSSSSRDT